MELHKFMIHLTFTCTSFLAGGVLGVGLLVCGVVSAVSMGNRIE